MVPHRWRLEPEHALAEGQDLRPTTASMAHHAMQPTDGIVGNRTSSHMNSHVAIFWRSALP